MWASAVSDRIEAALARALTEIDRAAPPRLASAIRYAVFPGGARVRPRLCVAVAEACGGGEEALVDAAACAVELLHCASLVHDDLPCFDDAPERRGKPSVHRAFDEPLAVLVGDALIVLAFETLAREGSARVVPLVSLLAQATGASHGLVAGQGWESEPSIPLERYHRAKTGALFVAAAAGGALASGSDPQPWRLVGERLGQAYQVADDLFDAHASADVGKPVRRDAALERPSFAVAHGTAASLARLQVLIEEAVGAVPDVAGASTLRPAIRRMAERLVPPSLKLTAA